MYDLTFPVQETSSSFNREKKFQARRASELHRSVYIAWATGVLDRNNPAWQANPCQGQKKMEVYMSQAKENRISRDSREAYDVLHDILNFSYRIIQKATCNTKNLITEKIIDTIDIYSNFKWYSLSVTEKGLSTISRSIWPLVRLRTRTWWRDSAFISDTLPRCLTKEVLFTHDWIMDRNCSCHLGELLITCSPSLHWRMSYWRD